jgi:ABC-type multidrug transport system fused ATPase/permease subunit
LKRLTYFKSLGEKFNKNTLLLLKLVGNLAANNRKSLALYSVTLLVDGLLIVFVATSIAPIADFFLDPSFARASGITVKYIYWITSLDLDPGLEIFLLIFVIANVAKATSGALLHYYSRCLAYLFVHDLSTKGLSAFMSSSMLFFLSNPLGTLLNTLQRESEKLGDGILSSLTMTAALLQLFILAYVAWVLSNSMLIVCFVLVVLLLILTRGLNRKILHFSSLTTNASNILTQSLVETLVGAKIVLSYGRGSLMVEKYSRAYKGMARFAVISQTLQNGLPMFFQAFGFFAVSIALLMSIQNGENVPTLIAALWTLMRMVPLFSQLLGNFTFISNVIPSFNQYNSILLEAEKKSLQFGDKLFNGFKQSLLLNAVSFKYPDREAALLDLSVVIKKGSFTAFVGESGSGKTTTADILMNLLIPDAGTVQLDLMQLQEYDLQSYLDRIGYVPQESFLFNTSIKENLLWSVLTASDDDLWKALRLANIEDFVASLPLKLDTLVGDRGVSLSGGQRQRIALARALLKKPDILILDEATSALDSESERMIMKSIDVIAPNTTILVIAHRLSTVARADLVCVFSKGRIVEIGSYSHLCSNPDSKLSSLIAAQQLG